jgi:hypothetical protein
MWMRISSFPSSRYQVLNQIYHEWRDPYGHNGCNRVIPNRPWEKLSITLDDKSLAVEAKLKA